MSTFFMIVAAIVVVALAFKVKGKDKATGRKAPAVPEEPRVRELHNLTWNHGAYLKAFDRAQVPATTCREEVEKVLHGMVGEQKVMGELAYIPGGFAVYWNVGLKVVGRMCEIDHLLVTPNGIILIEDKNLRGRWEPYGPYSERPDKWQRVDHNEKVLTSPFVQAHRAAGILIDLLKEIKVYLPIEKVIVFCDPSADFGSIQDDRARICYPAGLAGCIEQAQKGLASAQKPGHPMDVLHLMAFLAKEGVLPAFFDQRLLLSFIHPKEPSYVDAKAILEALFEQAPAPGFAWRQDFDRPKVVREEVYPDTVKRILAGYLFPQVQTELARKASGMAFPGDEWERHARGGSRADTEEVAA